MTERDGASSNKLYFTLGNPQISSFIDFDTLTDTGFASDLSQGDTVAALKNPTNQKSYDESCMDRHPPGVPSKKAFTYFTIWFGRFFLAAGLRLFLCHVILSTSASKDMLAMASLEMDVSIVADENIVTVKWRGKPVFVRNRTEDDIKLANSVNLSELRDPQADSDRASNPIYLIVIGVRDMCIFLEQGIAVDNLCASSTVLPMSQLSLRHLRSHSQGACTEEP